MAAAFAGAVHTALGDLCFSLCWLNSCFTGRLHFRHLMDGEFFFIRLNSDKLIEQINESSFFIKEQKEYMNLFSFNYLIICLFLNAISTSRIILLYFQYLGKTLFF